MIVPQRKDIDNTRYLYILYGNDPIQVSGIVSVIVSVLWFHQMVRQEKKPPENVRESKTDFFLTVSVSSVIIQPHQDRSGDLPRSRNPSLCH